MQVFGAEVAHEAACGAARIRVGKVLATLCGPTGLPVLYLITWLPSTALPKTLCEMNAL